MLLLGILQVALASGQGVPTGTDKMAPAVKARWLNEDPLDDFIATHSNREVASSLRSITEGRDNLLFRKPTVLLRLHNLEQEFLDGAHGDNVQAHFSSFAREMEKLNGSQSTRLVAFAAVA
ncbi:hypothetical protein IWW57_004008, partial [Coemansia sp. S610]